MIVKHDDGDTAIRILEADLKAKLYEVIASIKGIVSTDQLITTSPVLLYEDEVNAMLRAFAQNAYMVGTSQTAQKVGHEAYLTHTDVDAIKSIGLEHSARFWARIDQGIVNKERQARMLNVNESQTTHLSKEWLVDAIASSLCYTAYNQAIKIKASKLAT